jgi:hypothetical protein
VVVSWGKRLSSWLRELMPSFMKTLRKWYWTVRLRRRRPLTRDHFLECRVGLDQPDHADQRRGHGRARAGEGRLPKYVRFVAPLLGILFVVTCAFLALGAALD